MARSRRQSGCGHNIGGWWPLEGAGGCHKTEIATAGWVGDEGRGKLHPHRAPENLDTADDRGEGRVCMGPKKKLFQIKVHKSAHTEEHIVVAPSDPIIDVKCMQFHTTSRIMPYSTHLE